MNERIKSLEKALDITNNLYQYERKETAELRRCIGLAIHAMHSMITYFKFDPVVTEWDDILKQCDNALKHEMCRWSKIHE